MRKRLWVAFSCGLLSLGSCSDSCGEGCAQCQSSPESSTCSAPTNSATSTGSSSTLNTDGTKSSGSTQSVTTTAAPSSNAGSDDTQTDESTITNGDDSADETADAADSVDESSSAGAGSSDERSDPSDVATTSDESVGNETSDESSDAPVSPDDGASDSAARLKTVPVGDSEAALGYWEYLPPNYDDAPAPLLVFTHGASWQGNGSEEELQELLTVGPVNLISEDKWPNSRPFVVLAPQNSHSGCFTADDIDGFYRYALDTYNIDPTRIYHTGQSCGAIGGWNYLAAHLDEFVTAAVLISGDGQDAFAQAGCDLGRIAIWGLHNEKDGSVNSAGTINPIMDLMMCDPVPDVKLTIYPDATEHDAWTKTFDLSAGNDIYSWLLEHTHP